MASYTLKELKEMSTEELICKLVTTSSTMTKAVKQTEDKIFKVLAERNVINYDVMKTEYKRMGMW